MGRIWAIACGMVMSLSAALAATPTTVPATLPAPDAISTRAAMRQVQELWSMRKLDARGLLALSLNTTSSPALRYAAALHAMEIAADAGQVQPALDAIDELHTRFGDDELTLGSALVKRLAKASHNEPAAVLACRYLDAALAVGRQQSAEDLASLISKLRPALNEQAAAFCADAIEDFRYACQIHPLAATTTGPYGSAAYSCLYENRWAQHLDGLAHSNGDLAEIAQADLASTDTASQMLVAERWWRAAQQAGGRTGWRIARRACAIYEACLPHVDGVQKALITSRMAEHQRQAMIHTGMLPGVIREIWKEGDTARSHQQTAAVDLPRDAKIPGMPRTDAHVRYTGQLFVEQSGRYELTCIAGSGLRVKIDGRELVNNPKAYSKRNGEKMALDLAAGLHLLEIETWAASSQPRLDLQWMTPGSAQKQPIPESALFHDPLAQ
jgi:hypothetical protein